MTTGTASISANNVDSLINDIDNVIGELKKDTNSCQSSPKVIVIGNTGSGKSTLCCKLSDKKLTVVEKKGKKYALDGEGISNGFTSQTEIPTLTRNKSKECILVDCPGFLDTSKTRQEIINACSIDSLFETSSEHENKFKVLLVTSDAEINANRGQSIVQSIERVSKMFKDISKVKAGLGLIITGGSRKLTGKDYLDQMKEKAPDDLKKWIGFFEQNINQVFVMPKPSSHDVGKQYTFNDEMKLNKFFSENYITNPESIITLNNEALQEVKNLQITNKNNIKSIINGIFEGFKEKYNNIKDSKKLQEWIDMMKCMKKEKIKNKSKLAKFIDEKNQNSQEFNQKLNYLGNYEKFDSFINKALGNKNTNSKENEIISKEIDSCLEEIIKDLTEKHSLLKENEEQAEKNKELGNKIEEQDINLQKMKTKNEELEGRIAQQNQSLQQMEKSNEELNTRIQNQGTTIKNIKDENERLQNENNKINETINEQKNQMENLKTKLDDSAKNEINMKAAIENMQKENKRLEERYSQLKEEKESFSPIGWFIKSGAKLIGGALLGGPAGAAAAWVSSGAELVNVAANSK